MLSWDTNFFMPYCIWNIATILSLLLPENFQATTQGSKYIFPQPQNSQVGVEWNHRDAQGTPGSQGAAVVGIGRCQTLLGGKWAQEKWGGNRRGISKGSCSEENSGHTRVSILPLVGMVSWPWPSEMKQVNDHSCISAVCMLHICA